MRGCSVGPGGRGYYVYRIIMFINWMRNDKLTISGGSGCGDGVLVLFMAFKQQFDCFYLFLMWITGICV